MSLSKCFTHSLLGRLGYLHLTVLTFFDAVSRHATMQTRKCCQQCDVSTKPFHDACHVTRKTIYQARNFDKMTVPCVVRNLVHIKQLRQVNYKQYCESVIFEAHTICPLVSPVQSITLLL